MTFRDFTSNVLNSGKYAGINFVKNKFSASNDLISNIRDEKDTIVEEAIDLRSTFRDKVLGNMLQKGFDSTKESLKTGKLVRSDEEETADMMAGFFGGDEEGFDFSDDFNSDSETDDDFNFDDTSDGPSINKNINVQNRTNKIVNVISKSNNQDMIKAVNTSANMQGRLTFSTNKVLISNINKTNELLSSIKENIVEQGQTSIKLFNETQGSIEYRNMMSAVAKDAVLQLQEINKVGQVNLGVYGLNTDGEKLNSGNILKSKYDEAVFDEYGGFSSGNYAKGILKKGKSVIEDLEMLEPMFAKPTEMFASILTDKLVPKEISQSFERFDKIFSSIPAVTLLTFEDWAKNTDEGLWAGAKRFTGGILKADSVSGSSLSSSISSYNKGPIPFDGMTKKAITEVIPSYLRMILNAIKGGKDGDEQIFDYKTGTFKTKDKILNDLNNQRFNKFSSSEINSDIKKEIMGSYDFKSEEEKAKYDKEINRVMASIANAQGKYTGKHEDSNVDAGILDKFNKIFDSLSREDQFLYQRERTAARAEQAKFSEVIKSDDGGVYRSALSNTLQSGNNEALDDELKDLKNKLQKAGVIGKNGNLRPSMGSKSVEFAGDIATMKTLESTIETNKRNSSNDYISTNKSSLNTSNFTPFNLKAISTDDILNVRVVENLCNGLNGTGKGYKKANTPNSKTSQENTSVFSAKEKNTEVVRDRSSREKEDERSKNRITKNKEGESLSLSEKMSAFRQQNFTKDNMMSVIKNPTKLISGIANRMGDTMGDLMFGKREDEGNSLISSVKDNIKGKIDWFDSKFKLGIGWFKGKFSNIFEGIKGKISFGIDWFKDKFSNIFEGITAKFKLGFDWAKDKFSMLSGKFFGKDGVFGKILNSFSGKFDLIKTNFINKAIEPLKKNFDFIKTSFKSSFGKVWDNLNLSLFDANKGVFGSKGFLASNFKKSISNIPLFKSKGALGKDGKLFGAKGFFGENGKLFGSKGIFGDKGKLFRPTGLFGAKGKLFGTKGFLGAKGKLFGVDGFFGEKGKMFGDNGLFGKNSKMFGEKSWFGSKGPIFGEKGFLGEKGKLFKPTGFLGTKGPIFGSKGFLGKNGKLFGNDGLFGKNSKMFGEKSWFGSKGPIFGKEGFLGVDGKLFGAKGFFGKEGYLFKENGIFGKNSKMFGEKSWFGSKGPIFGKEGFLGSEGKLFGAKGFFGKEGYLFNSKTGFFGKAKDYIANTFESTKDFLNKTLWTPFKETLVKDWNTIKSWSSKNLIEPLKGTLDPFLVEFKHQFGNLKTWLKEDLWGGMKKGFDDIFAVTFGKPFSQMMEEKVLNPLKDTLSTVKGFIGKTLGKVLKMPVDFIKKTSDNLRMKQLARKEAADAASLEATKKDAYLGDVIGEANKSTGDWSGGVNKGTSSEASISGVKSNLGDVIQDTRIPDNSGSSSGIEKSKDDKVGRDALSNGDNPPSANASKTKTSLKIVSEDDARVAATDSRDTLKKIHSFMIDNLSGVSFNVAGIAKKMKADGVEGADGVYKGFFRRQLDKIMKPFNWVGEKINSVKESVMSIPGKIIDTTKSFVEETWKGIRKVSDGLWEGFKNVTSTLFKGINALGPALTTAAKGIYTVAKDILVAEWSIIKDITKGIWNGFTDLAKATGPLIEGLWGGLKDLGKGLLDISKPLISAFSSVTASLVKTAGTILNEGLKFVASTVRSISNAVFGGAKKLLGKLNVQQVEIVKSIPLGMYKPSKNAIKGMMSVDKADFENKEGLVKVTKDRLKNLKKNIGKSVTEKGFGKTLLETKNNINESLLKQKTELTTSLSNRFNDTRDSLLKTKEDLSRKLTDGRNDVKGKFDKTKEDLSKKTGSYLETAKKRKEDLSKKLNDKWQRSMLKSNLSSSKSLSDIKETSGNFLKKIMMGIMAIGPILSGLITPIIAAVAGSKVVKGIGGLLGKIPGASKVGGFLKGGISKISGLLGKIPGASKVKGVLGKIPGASSIMSSITGGNNSLTGDPSGNMMVNQIICNEIINKGGSTDSIIDSVTGGSSTSTGGIKGKAKVISGSIMGKAKSVVSKSGGLLKKGLTFLKDKLPKNFASKLDPGKIANFISKKIPVSKMAGLLGKFAGPIALAVTGATAAYGGYKAWKGAEDMSGWNPEMHKPLSLADRGRMAVGGAISKILLGLVEPLTIAKVLGFKLKPLQTKKDKESGSPSISKVGAIGAGVTGALASGKVVSLMDYKKTNKSSGSGFSERDRSTQAVMNAASGIPQSTEMDKKIISLLEKIAGNTSISAMNSNKPVNVIVEVPSIKETSTPAQSNQTINNSNVFAQRSISQFDGSSESVEVPSAIKQIAQG